MNTFGPENPNYRILPARVASNGEIIRLVYSTDEPIEPGGLRKHFGLYALSDQLEANTIELRLDEPVDGSLA